VDRGIRIYAIGFGTMNGTLSFDNSGGSGGPGNPGGGFGGGGGGRGGFRTAIDEATMKKIAEMTGGEYYTASSADELQKVFQSLPTYLITKHEVTEISFIFAAIGALLVLCAIGLSLVWHPLPG
jgi:Ca-activated chloride channel family protein